jgi:hypothetical protein
MSFHEKFIAEKAIWMAEYSSGKKVWEFDPQTGEEIVWSKELIPTKVENDSLKYLYLMIRPKSTIEHIYGFDLETGVYLCKGDRLSLGLNVGKDYLLKITQRPTIYEPIQYKHVVCDPVNTAHIYEKTWNIGYKLRFEAERTSWFAKVILTIDSRTFEPLLSISGHSI